MGDQVSDIVGLDGKPLAPAAKPMQGMDELPPGTVVPEWLPGIEPGTRIVIAGWWWRLEQAVTNGEGQWALILTPIEATGATRKKHGRVTQ